MQVFTDIAELFETISSSVTKLHIGTDNEENKRYIFELSKSNFFGAEPEFPSVALLLTLLTKFAS